MIACVKAGVSLFFLFKRNFKLFFILSCLSCYRLRSVMLEFIIRHFSSFVFYSILKFLLLVLNDTCNAFLQKINFFHSVIDMFLNILILNCCHKCFIMIIFHVYWLKLWIFILKFLLYAKNWDTLFDISKLSNILFHFDFSLFDFIILLFILNGLIMVV